MVHSSPIFYSLLFVSIVCESFAAFGKAEPRNLQIAESDSPREVLKKALSAARSVTSYRRRIEAPSVGKAVTIEEFTFPDSVRMFDQNEETISIGKDTYHKKGDGPWQKYLARNGYVSRTNLPATALENQIKSLAEVRDVNLIGQETVDGVPTLAYRYIMRDRIGPTMVRSWIGMADGLPRRWESECVVGLREATVVYTYYDYNAAIKIEPPTEYVLVPLAFPGPAFHVCLQPKRDELMVTPLPGPPSLGPGSGDGLGPGSGGGKEPGIRTEPNPNAPSTKVDSKPVLLNNPQPRYTEEARENKVEGTVQLRLLIGSDGLVKRVTIVRGLPDGLDEQAIQAAYQLRFKPAMKGGEPVAYQQSVLIEFNLRKR